MKALLGILFLSNLALAEGGTTVGDGGSVVIDGERYEIADLHFKPTPYDGFKIGPSLSVELERIHFALHEMDFDLSKPIGFDTLTDVRRWSSFLRDDILSELTEYRFVKELPADCRYIRPNELADSVRRTLNVGCTIGYVTYLLPGPFSKLPLTGQALLIMHERLHVFWPNQAYEIKADLIAGAAVLVENFRPAPGKELPRARMKPNVSLDPDQVRVLNLLSRRVAQLQQRKKFTVRRFGIAGELTSD